VPELSHTRVRKARAEFLADRGVSRREHFVWLFEGSAVRSPTTPPPPPQPIVWRTKRYSPSNVIFEQKEKERKERKKKHFPYTFSFFFSFFLSLSFSSLPLLPSLPLSSKLHMALILAQSSQARDTFLLPERLCCGSRFSDTHKVQHPIEEVPHGFFSPYHTTTTEVSFFPFLPFFFFFPFSFFPFSFPGFSFPTDYGDGSFFFFVICQNW